MQVLAANLLVLLPAGGGAGEDMMMNKLSLTKSRPAKGNNNIQGQDGGRYIAFVVAALFSAWKVLFFKISVTINSWSSWR
jgi:hypothetical protein